MLVASVIDLEARLTDAALDMADKLIGGLFARARKVRERRYVAGTRNVGRLMRLFHAASIHEQRPASQRTALGRGYPLARNFR